MDKDGWPDCATAAGVATVGPRYIEVTPLAIDAPLALVVELNQPGCTALGFVDFDENSDLADQGIARLVDAPVYRNGGDWGTLLVRDELIVPGATYKVQPILLNGIIEADEAETTTFQTGDVDNSGFANFGDIQLVVQGFQGTFGGSLGAVALAPCLPNGIVNFEDIQYAVFAFQQQPYDAICSLPCTGGVAGTGPGAQ